MITADGRREIREAQRPSESFEATVTALRQGLGGKGPRVALLDYQLDDHELADGGQARYRGATVAGYLRDGDRYDPCPRAYLAAATRLGWPRTTLVKRIEYLRTRLTRAGVPGMNGHRAMENLAEHVLTDGLITKADLRLIDG